MSSEKEKSTKEVLQEYANKQDFLKELANILPDIEIEMLYHNRRGGTDREMLLEAARAAVCGERAEAYGNLEDNFSGIAAFWTFYLGFNVTAHDVANMMILLKVARNSTSGHRDNWVDIAGYAACGAEVDA